MNSRPVGAWIPIRTPEWDHPDRLQKYEAARDQFIAQLPSVIASLSDRVRLHKVAVEEPPEKLFHWFKEKSFLAGTRLFEYIHLEGTADVDEAWLSQQTDVEENFVLAVAVNELSTPLELTLVLSELAYPGCIDTLECALVSDQVFVNTLPKKSSHTRLGFPESPVWPAPMTIELRVVVDWAKQTNILTHSLANSRVERTLAAYSHIIGLTWRRDGELLFRAMQGLEAFYIDGTGDLRRQLSTKVQLWLGPWNGNKNVVGHLYDLRSAFVHGSSQIAFWNRDGKAWDEDETHMRKFEEHVDLSLRLLIRTIQECITRGVTMIEWSYEYKTNGDQDLRKRGATEAYALSNSHGSEIISACIGLIKKLRLAASEEIHQIASKFPRIYELVDSHFEPILFRADSVSIDVLYTETGERNASEQVAWLLSFDDPAIRSAISQQVNFEAAVPIASATLKAWWIRARNGARLTINSYELVPYLEAT